jgi:hypothetical protein
MAALEGEDADVVLLFVLGTALELEVVASPAKGEIWSVLPIMMEWELVRCNKQ